VKPSDGLEPSTPSYYGGTRRRRGQWEVRIAAAYGRGKDGKDGVRSGSLDRSVAHQIWLNDAVEPNESERTRTLP
jgi:hypothetical protein